MEANRLLQRSGSGACGAGDRGSSVPVGSGGEEDGGEWGEE